MNFSTVDKPHLVPKWKGGYASSIVERHMGKGIFSL